MRFKNYRYNLFQYIRAIALLALTSAHLPGVQGVRTSALFQYSPNCALKFLNQFRKNTLKNQFKKRKNPSKRCTNRNSLDVFEMRDKRMQN